jgi:citronellol/citronellal dehydrogenase
VIFCRSSREYSGNFALDEDVLREAGVTDLSGYSEGPSDQLLPDLFL